MPLAFCEGKGYAWGITCLHDTNIFLSLRISTHLPNEPPSRSRSDTRLEFGRGADPRIASIVGGIACDLVDVMHAVV